MCYSKAFSKALQAGDLMTRTEMTKLLDKRGAWGKPEEARLEELQEAMTDVAVKVAIIKKQPNPNQKQLDKNREIWKDIREEFNKLISERTDLLNNTVEGKSEEEELKAKLSRCVKYADKTNVWESLEQLNKEDDNM